MIKNFKYRMYDKADKQSVLALHKDVFADVTLEGWREGYAKRLERQLAPDKAVVALDSNKIVGMVSFDRFRDMDYNNLLSLQHKLFHAHFGRHSKDSRQAFRRDLEWKRDKLGVGKIVLEFFPEVFYEYPLAIHGDSVYATDFVVHSEHQNNGLGFELARYTLDYIKKIGTPSIYAQIIDSTPVRTICERLRFHSLLRFGPEYENGGSSIIMGRDLQSKDS